MFFSFFSDSSESQRINARLTMLERKLDAILEHLKIDWQSHMPSIDLELIDLLQQQGKIAAVKRYKERTGVTLLEAKRYVERL